MTDATDAIADIRRHCAVPAGVELEVTPEGHVAVLDPDGMMAFLISALMIYDGRHCEGFQQMIGALMCRGNPSDPIGDVLSRLEKYANLKVGQEIPPELGGPGGWGPPLTETIKDAIAVIRNLRAVAGAVSPGESFQDLKGRARNEG